MDLVPSGKTRVMVSQQFGNPLSEGFGRQAIDAKPTMGPSDSSSFESGPTLDTEGAMDEDLGEKPINDDVSMGSEEAQMEPTENRKTLTSYIFQKMESYGYPGRRLQDFKSEFVKESVSPEGQKDIEVIIPDKKYPNEQGFTDTIENEELKSIAHEVNQLFGLNFNGADRAGGKWTIKFTSANIVDPDQAGISHDTLDQVYGKPDKGSQPGQKPAVESGPPSASKPPAMASTIREMIKVAKEEFTKDLWRE